MSVASHLEKYVTQKASESVIAKRQKEALLATERKNKGGSTKSEVAKVQPKKVVYTTSECLLDRHMFDD
ncbi:MAG: hypothetical protein LBU58_11275 [Clostridiales bacterium]|jgi:hypothetical protein|nr:hypothetical protein [Clostridiales bacterium]